MHKISNQKGFLSIIVLLVAVAIIGYLSYSAVVQPGDNPQTEGFKKQIDKAKELVDKAGERVKKFEEEFAKDDGETEEGNKINVNLNIVTPEKTYEFSSEAIKDQSVFEIMKLIKGQEDFDFKYSESGIGVFINEIQGIENDSKNNMYWMLYINNELSEVGASDLKHSENDIIEWKYEDASSYWK